MVINIIFKTSSSHIKLNIRLTKLISCFCFLLHISFFIFRVCVVGIFSGIFPWKLFCHFFSHCFYKTEKEREKRVCKRDRNVVSIVSLLRGCVCMCMCVCMCCTTIRKRYNYTALSQFVDRYEKLILEQSILIQQMYLLFVR